MELVSTHLCKASEIGVHDNMFGGNIMALIDEASAAYACQICDTQRIVTIKIDEMVFKKPVKVGDILKIYAEVKEFGNSSLTMYIEVRKHNVFTSKEVVVTFTNIKFVRIDNEGNSFAIPEAIKTRYYERIKQFGKGLLNEEERTNEKLWKNN